MNRQQLDAYKDWFSKYVELFYTGDEYVDANLKLKQEHSLRVCREMAYLTDALGLSQDDRRIAEAIAIFHDIGRFKQFVEYRTYNDARSTNHCLLGLEVLRASGVLGELPDKERLAIERAVEYHGVKQLPTEVDGDCLKFCQMIRDADKLDVYHIAVGYYKNYKTAPKSFMLELEFPDEAVCSPHVVDAVLNERSIDYKSLRTLNDMLLCQLGWVYDINFAASLRRIKDRKYLETLLGYLPRTEEAAKVGQKILSYVDGRLAQTKRD